MAGSRGRGSAGFSLVELMVALTILGVLSAIIVLSVGALTSTTAEASCTTDARTLRTAEDAAMAAGGRYLSEPQLVAQQFLTEESTAFDIALSGTTAYTLTPTGSCSTQQAVGVTTTPTSSTTSTTAATTTTSSTTTSSTTTTSTTTTTTTTTTTAAVVPTVTITSIAPANGHKVTVSGTATVGGGASTTVTIAVCSSSSFPCASPDTFTATVQSNGTWSNTSGNVGSGSRWARASQTGSAGTGVSNVAGPVTA